MDDIAELKWFKLNNVPKLVGEHDILFNYYINFLEKNV